MTEVDGRYEILGARVEDRNLTVEWSDGHVSRFHPMWLRHQCECDFCGTTMDAVRGIRLHHIPEDIEPVLDGHTPETVEVVWNNDGHRSTYAARWLRDHCYSDKERRARKHRPTLWDASIAKDGPVADYTDMRQNPAARLSMLHSVRDYGFCKVENVPATEEDARHLIELVGEQRHTHYGTYNLTGRKSVDNVGDTTGPLDPHSDETYRLSTIGITVFQVFQPSTEGGHSTLVDGFEAVRRLRADHPEDVELLARTPITGQRLDRARNSDGRPRWFRARMPMIRLDEDGDVVGVRFNERQIAPLDVAEELIGPCYRALKRLFEILYDPALRLTFPLQSGEGLIFDNQRLLHGRTGYSSDGPPRAVLTSSVDIEEFHSTLRMLEIDNGRDGPQMRYTQGLMA